jgi:hypothetical protein
MQVWFPQISTAETAEPTTLEPPTTAANFPLNDFILRLCPPSPWGLGRNRAVSVPNALDCAA